MKGFFLHPTSEYTTKCGVLVQYNPTQFLQVIYLSPWNHTSNIVYPLYLVFIYFCMHEAPPSLWPYVVQFCHYM